MRRPHWMPRAVRPCAPCQCCSSAPPSQSQSDWTRKRKKGGRLPLRRLMSDNAMGAIASIAEHRQ
eukprot:4929072-Prorocentrum_lima.AAC.1